MQHEGPDARRGPAGGRRRTHALTPVSERLPGVGARCFLLDGMSLAYRAFFALPDDLATADGDRHQRRARLHLDARLPGARAPAGGPGRRLRPAPGPPSATSWSPDYKAGRAETPDDPAPAVRHDPPTCWPRWRCRWSRRPATRRTTSWPPWPPRPGTAAATSIVVTGDRDCFQLVRGPPRPGPLQPAGGERLRPLRRGRHRRAHRRRPRPVPDAGRAAGRPVGQSARACPGWGRRRRPSCSTPTATWTGSSPTSTRSPPSSGRTWPANEDRVRLERAGDPPGARRPARRRGGATSHLGGWDSTRPPGPRSASSSCGRCGGAWRRCWPTGAWARRPRVPALPTCRPSRRHRGPSTRRRAATERRGTRPAALRRRRSSATGADRGAVASRRTGPLRGAAAGRPGGGRLWPHRRRRPVAAWPAAGWADPGAATLVAVLVGRSAADPGPSGRRRRSRTRRRVGGALAEAAGPVPAVVGHHVKELLRSLHPPRDRLHGAWPWTPRWPPTCSTPRPATTGSRPWPGAGGPSRRATVARASWRSASSPTDPAPRRGRRRGGHRCAQLVGPLAPAPRRRGTARPCTTRSSARWSGCWPGWRWPGIRVDTDELRRIADELVADTQPPRGRDPRAGRPRVQRELHAPAAHRPLRRAAASPRGARPRPATRPTPPPSSPCATSTRSSTTLLRYREVEKLRSTYGESLLAEVAADGRIHASFRQTVARTGRLSSDRPNLHNIPVRTEGGRRFRRAFVPAPGLARSWSPTTTRSSCGSSPTCRATRDSSRPSAPAPTSTGRWPRASTGSPPSEVTHTQRERAKMVSYGLAYGMEAFGLARRLSTGVDEANEIMDPLLRGLPRGPALHGAHGGRGPRRGASPAPRSAASGHCPSWPTATTGSARRPSARP